MVTLTLGWVAYAAVAVWVGRKTWRDIRQTWPNHVAWPVVVTVAFATGWPLVVTVASFMPLVERAVQDYQQRHAPKRCRPDGCDCPCGYCRHDPRHVPGE